MVETPRGVEFSVSFFLGLSGQLACNVLSMSTAPLQVLLSSVTIFRQWPCDDNKV